MLAYARWKNDLFRSISLGIEACLPEGPIYLFEWMTLMGKLVILFI